MTGTAGCFSSFEKEVRRIELQLITIPMTCKKERHCEPRQGEAISLQTIDSFQR